MFRIDIYSVYSPEGKKYWQFTVNHEVVSYRIFHSEYDAFKEASNIIEGLGDDDDTSGKEVGRDS